MTQATPPTKNARVLIALAALLVLNYIFTNLMDESGLPVLMVSARQSQSSRNASAEALFEARASALAAESIAADASLLRLDILARRRAAATGDITYEFLQVHKAGGGDADALPASLASTLRVESSVHLRTVFPERSRWRQTPWQTRPGELAPLGDLALVAEHTTYTVGEADADSFARAWTELGYNSLGELGVVRCDLLQEAARPHVFIARKVFRGAEARAAHVASGHVARWREKVSGILGAPASATQELDTIYPRSSPFPFRSGWATV